MYSLEFKETIKVIYKNANLLPSEKLQQISALELEQQKKYIEENNVDAIYTLLKTKFSAFSESEYKDLESQNDDVFSKTYKQVQKLESFFQKIVNHYKGNSPYKENNEFTQALSKLNSEDNTITEKFDGLSRLVGNCEDAYIREKINELDDMHYELFNKSIERPTNLTMKNFSEFYDEQFIILVNQFEANMRNNSSFFKKNSAEILILLQFRIAFVNLRSANNRELLTEKFNSLKKEYDSHIRNERAEQSAENPLAGPTPSNQAKTNSNVGNQVPKTSTDNQQNNEQEDNIKKKLEAYKKRIEVNKTPEETIDYAYGFWFFKKSRAINRKINYLLAGKLLEYLNTNPGDFTIFKTIMELRQNIVAELTQEDKKYYADRGINSSELNEIIEELKLKK